MPYFADLYPSVALPVDTEAKPGLRNAQLGALHALAAHFTLRRDPRLSEPALVVLPTGAGKSAVLLVAAFLLRARRALVVSPSRAVRGQLAGEAATLATLRRLGVLPEDAPRPRVREVTGRVRSSQDWEALREFDFVVGTPASLSPGAKGVAPVPETELFDLVLMDEAHHSPAPTWSALLAAFPGARKVLCTATPFRLDEREIRARTVYEYPLGEALADRILCDLEYLPVEVPRGEDRDVALAKRAEQVLRAEQRADPSYRLMVRTDRKSHARELLDRVYRPHTQLKLRTVHSGHSQGYVDRCLRQLRSGTGELDGILCVDMLGEGFDFPPLKVAAIHRKHKSLPVTLQFVGRFGRVTRRQGGPGGAERAKILAVPEELDGDLQHLYRESSAWADLIPHLHRWRLEEDEAARQALATFRPVGTLPEELAETSLWGLEPRCHVKVYEVEPRVEIDLRRPIDGSRLPKIVYRSVSDELSAAVLLARRPVSPPWAGPDVTLFDRQEFDLFVLHWNAPARLLFISSSRSGSVGLYEALARQFTAEDLEAGDEGRHRILPLYKLNRVLRGYAGASCFNLGMRNRQVSQVAETYRILAGSEVDRAIRRSDGRLFHRGHVMIGLMDDEEERLVTLGYSSSSKVWMAKSVRVSSLVEWCQDLAAKIADDSPVDLGENLEALPVGEPLTDLPDDLMAACWHEDVFFRSLRLVDPGPAGAGAEPEELCELHQASWSVGRESAGPRSVPLALEVGERAWSFVLDLDAPRLVRAGDAAAERLRVRQAHEEGPLADFLAETPLQLYTADFSRIQGLEIFRAPAGGLEPFDPRCFRPIDWPARAVVISREFGWTGDDAAYTRDGFDPTSIHGALADDLEAEGFPVILYDHGSGEIADFLAFEERGKGAPVRWRDGEFEDRPAVHVYLFHAKGAQGAQPGNRVGDAYEVCGQVVKSLIWVADRKALAAQLERRALQKSFFLRGSAAEAKRWLEQRALPVVFHIGLVQPGITASGCDPKIREILAAGDDYVRRAVGTPAFVVCSA